MKIALASDLHLEFGNINWYSEADYTILAGDICPGTAGISWAKWASEGPVIYIPGNHEFYGYDIIDHQDAMNDAADQTENVHCLQNKTYKDGNLRIIGATLWTDFKLTGDQHFSMDFAPRYMNDYRLVKEGYTLLTPETILSEFNKSYDFIVSELEHDFDGITIVVTHHGPTPQSVHPLYTNSMGNEFFCSDLTDLIEKHQPDFWFHGHTHSTLDYMVGNTHVRTNPKGYPIGPGENENAEFDPKFTIDL